LSGFVNGSKSKMRQRDEWRCRNVVRRIGLPRTVFAHEGDG
jgi:hypothetical protein